MVKFYSPADLHLDSPLNLNNNYRQVFDVQKVPMRALKNCRCSIKRRC